MDKYDLIKTVGKGSYGDVNLVSRKGDPKLYVMKVVTNTTGDDDSSVEAMREVNIMKKFRHPNIVEFTECFCHNEGTNLCIVMGYCECGDLGHQIQAARKRRKFLRESDILDWFVQLALALKYLHGHHVLHRDLKPQNVFLTNQYKILKLGDFGITKVLDDTFAQAVTTIGTPYYFSPEICQSKPYGMQSDIWAAGCIIYELMVLQVPFMASKLTQLVQKILWSKPASPNNKLYSRDLLTLVAAMLAKGPERRPTIKKVLATPVVRNHLATFTERYASLYEGTDLGYDSHQSQELEQIQNLRDTITTNNPKTVLPLLSQAGGVGEQLDSVEEKGETPRQAENEPDIRLVSVAKQAHEASRQSEEKDDIDDIVNLCTRELHLEQEEDLNDTSLEEDDGYDSKIADAPKTPSKTGKRSGLTNLKVDTNAKMQATQEEIGEVGKSLIKTLATRSPMRRNLTPNRLKLQREASDRIMAELQRDGPVKGKINIEEHTEAKRPSRPSTSSRRRPPSPRTQSVERKEKGELGRELLCAESKRKMGNQEEQGSGTPSLMRQASDFERGMNQKAVQHTKQQEKAVRERTPSYEQREARSRARASPRSKRPSSASRRIRLSSIEGS